MKSPALAMGGAKPIPVNCFEDPGILASSQGQMSSKIKCLSSLAFPTLNSPYVLSAAIFDAFGDEEDTESIRYF